MKNNLHCLAVLFLFFSGVVYTQTIKIKGIVKDSIGGGLEMANVIAFTKNTNEMAEYAITDSKGRYSINLEAGQVYEFKVSYMGFDTETVSVDLVGVQEDLSKNITLKETKDVLDYETKMEANITDRWKADMNSDSWLSKNVRPLVLIFLVVCTVLMIFIDAGTIAFEVEEKWTDN